MDSKTDAAQELIHEIRRSFQVLRGVGDRMNRDIGVTAAMRSVMEALAAAGPRTVPDIAQEKHVSRQHIQKNVDELISAHLVCKKPNPAHKRSVLIGLTADGEQLFESMRAAELELLKQVVETLPAGKLEQAAHSLAAFRQRLEIEL